MLTDLSPYRKALAAILGAVGVVVLAALTDNRIDTAEAFVIGIAGLNGVAVYLVPNIPGSAGASLKFAISAVLAVVQAVALYREGGLSPQEIALVTVAGLTALGVYVVPNEPTNE
jgi:uncharacterized membrane protein